MSAFAQQAQIQFRTHQEHEKDYADLRNDVQRRPDGSWKDVGRDRRRDPAEQRWTEQYPREDLANHRRLMNVAEQRPERPREADHGDQRDQHMQEVAAI